MMVFRGVADKEKNARRKASCLHLNITASGVPKKKKPDWRIARRAF
jgi:hypothetical protein